MPGPVALRMGQPHPRKNSLQHGSQLDCSINFVSGPEPRTRTALTTGRYLHFTGGEDLFYSRTSKGKIAEYIYTYIYVRVYEQLTINHFHLFSLVNIQDEDVAKQRGSRVYMASQHNSALSASSSINFTCNTAGSILRTSARS